MPPYFRDKPRKPRPAALACTECRRRHLKCDARLPVCSRCSESSYDCRYLKSRRGGKRKYPILSNDTRDGLEIDNSDNRGVVTPSSQQLHADTSPGATLLYLNRSWTGASEQQTGSSIIINSPIAIPQQRGISSPESLRSLQEQQITSSNEAIRSPAEETLVELYYENFHRTHPILLPKVVYDSGRRYPRYLNLVIQYIGSHYSIIPSAALRALAAAELAGISDAQASLPAVQAKLLFATVLYSNEEAQEARKWLSQAIDTAVALGMNKKSFVDFYYAQQGADLEAESARRTWWELYVLDGLISALDHRGMSNFSMSIIECDVEMPCEEAIYAEGKPIPIPHSRQEFDSRVFAESEPEEENTVTGRSDVLSSFAYRIDAIDLLAQVLAVRYPNRARRDKTQAVDNTLASWAHYLPASKADIVNTYGEIDEMLLQAHMMVQLAVILLHFPRSNLNLDCATLNGNDTDITLLYGPLSQRLPPSSTRHIHGIKATEASKRLSNLFSLCTSMQKHSPLFMFGLSICGLVQLATFCAHARIDTSLSCLEQHRARVRLIVGLLKSSSETWTLSKVIQKRLKRVAVDVFQMKKPDPPPATVPEPSSNVEVQTVPMNPHSDITFQLENGNTWMPLAGQFDLPELAPWVWG